MKEPKLYLCIQPPTRVQRVLHGFQEEFVPSPVQSAVPFHLSVKTQPGLTPDLRWLADVQEVVNGFSRFTCTVSTVPKQFPEGIAYLPAYSDQVVLLHRAIVRAVKPPKELSRAFFELSLYTPHVTVTRPVDLDLAEALCEQGETYFERGVFRFRVKELSLQIKEPGDAHYRQLMALPLRAA